VTTPDIRLIAVDMDGTLLLPDGSIPDGIWPLLDEMAARGIAFAPASGGSSRRCSGCSRAFPETRLHRRERRVRRAR
jgi:hydroxymethylpyrimidine pyrophosphatase-like HAD family hydrolase